MTDSPYPTSFVFRWRWYLRGRLLPFWGVVQFSWVSLVYTGGMHVIKLLFVFLLLLHLVLQGGLSQEPRRKEGNIIPLFQHEPLCLFLDCKWYEVFQLVLHFGGGIPLAP